MVQQDSNGKILDLPQHLQNKGSLNQIPHMESRLNESSQVQSHPHLAAMMHNNGSM